MKILQVLPKFDKGGVEKASILLSEFLISTGHTSYICAEPGAFTDHHLALGGKTLDLKAATKNPFQLLVNAFKIARYVKRHGIDVIHARSRAPAWSCLLAARLSHTPLVTTFHATYNFGSAIKKFYNSVMVRGDRVIAISEFIAQHIDTHYHRYCREGSVVLIPEGVAVATAPREENTQEAASRLRSELGIGPEAKLILMPARLTPWKGQHVVLTAFAGIADRFPEAHLVFIGSEAGRQRYRQQLQTTTSCLTVGDRVHFVGHRADLVACLPEAWCVVHASTEPEAFGRILIEAMAAGVLVIASALGAPREIITPGVTGFLAEADNAGDLAARLAQVLSLGSMERRHMGARARASVEKRYALKEVLQQHVACYKSLIASKT